MLPDETLDRRPDGGLREDQVGNRDLVARVEIAGKGRKTSVWNADRERRRVLERIRHREQEHVHEHLIVLYGNILSHVVSPQTEKP
jgi:hypothetical protein